MRSNLTPTQHDLNDKTNNMEVENDQCAVSSDS